MNFVSNLLRATGWTGFSGDYEWMNKVFDALGIALYIILALVGAAGVIYSIYLGIQLARAEDQSKRDDAKKHLITVIIAVAVSLLLVLFFNELLPLIVKNIAPESVVNPAK